MTDAKFESLKGKRVLITGSSRGIGRALAIGFAQNGADVALHGISHGRAMDEALELVSQYGTKTVAVLGDLCDPEAPEKIIKEVIERLGGIDILICNASIQITGNWLDITQEDMQAQVQANLFATVKLMQSSVPDMLKNGWGRIITIGSTQQEKPLPNMLIYSGLKSAMLNMVQNLALQLAEKNITVNNIAVGTIYTDRNVEVLKDEAYHKKIRDLIPIKRIGNPEDCVAPVLMLSSDAGSYITGENLHVDGGKYI